MARRDDSASRALSFEPPHAGDIASRAADAGNSPGDRLDGDRHVEGVGVNKAAAFAHDGDMALPEYEITALQFGKIGACRHWSAQRRFLHVAVARASHAAGHQRNLHQARAVDAEYGLAAPQIRHAQKTFGDRDEVALV